MVALFFRVLLPVALLASTPGVAAAGADLPLVPPELRVELFAREPLVRNPAAMAFDARGRLFVGHGPQYRRPTPDTPPDSVVILTDTTGDGIADTAKTFATGFNCIQGLAWHGRDLWVGNAPDLTIVRDLDGDDEADEYIRVYGDLGNIEHGVHGLHWGPDGKLYFSKGNSKGLTQPGRVAPKPFLELWDVSAPPGTPDIPPPQVFRKGEYRALYQDPNDDWGREGGLLRADDLGANLEIVARGLRNPFDLAFDSGFNWLGTDNDQSYGDRIVMPFYGAHFGWGHRWSAHWTGDDHPPTVPVSGPVFDGSGTGVLHYDGPHLPPAYRGVWLINDWLRNTTFLYRPRWEGALLQPEGGQWQEFIRGRDALYRPVDLRVGPEGALYVTGWGAELGVVWKDGEQVNEGRVFRISWPAAPKPAWNTPERTQPLSQWTFAQLAEDLDGALPVWRVDAQNELVRRGESVRGDLIALLARSDLTELRQTWALWALGRILPQDRTVDDWFAARAADGGFNVRQQSLRILAYRVREHRPRDTLPAVVVDALRDPEPRLRFTAVQALHEARQGARADALASTAATETDRLTFYAAWRALRDLAEREVLKEWLRDPRGGVRRAALLALLDLGALAPEEVTALVSDPDPQTAEVAALWGAKRDGNPLIVIEPQAGAFTDAVRVKLTPGVKPGVVRYTFDGSEPTLESHAHNTLNLTETTSIRAALFVEGRQVGPSVKATWRRRPPLSPDDLATLLPPERPTTMEDVLPLLATARKENGRPVFNAAGCQVCHRLGDQGGIFGPDLTAYGDRANAEHLIRSILHPNDAITEGFALLSVQMRDGEGHAGLLREETDRILSLVLADGSVLNLDKGAVVSRQSLHTSPMPSFASVINPRQMAEMVAWLLSERSLSSGMPAVSALASDDRAFAWELRDDRLVIRAGDRPVADYVFRDPQVLRPHFQNLHAPSGVQVTRNHPPAEGDATDHATMHPGVWLAFGDINGEDFWRNKGHIGHGHFSELPSLREGALVFATENTLRDRDDRRIGTLTSRFRMERHGDAFRLVWDATLKPTGRPLVFGEQEEMGLGVRVATPLTERNGGLIVNSDGARGARAAWGQVADWCDYAGTVNGRRVGAAVLADPANPWRSWWHARDYGLVVANPFGQRVLPAASEGRLTVPAGEELRLRFGVLLYDTPTDSPPDVAAGLEWLRALPR